MAAATRWPALALLLALGACGAHPPGSVETALMTGLKHRLTVGGGSARNPLEPTEALLAKGQADFSHYCTACHGLDGHGTGVPFAAAMSPPVPDLGSPAVQRYSDGQLQWIVENGLSPSGMPASRELLNEEERWRIVLFLRHLPPPGSLGEPPAYRDPPP
jgi:mono/diheme cytochrome c family protein